MYSTIIPLFVLNCFMSIIVTLNQRVRVRDYLFKESHNLRDFETFAKKRSPGRFCYQHCTKKKRVIIRTSNLVTHDRTNRTDSRLSSVIGREQEGLAAGERLLRKRQNFEYINIRSLLLILFVLLSLYYPELASPRRRRDTT